MLAFTIIGILAFISYPAYRKVKRLAPVEGIQQHPGPEKTVPIRVHDRDKD